MKLNLAMTVVSVLAFTTCAQAAQRSAADGAGQNFPTKPIRVIVPQAPGGSNDIMARYFGGHLSDRIGRPVVVDNRPGAEGTIGTEIVARAAPDGYTLLMASRAFTMNPAVIRKLPYHPIKDFDWVAMLGNGPTVILVGPSVPVKSLQDLIALGKAKPNYITMASAGGFMHFVSAMFRSHAGIDAVIALYKGGAPALIDVMSGRTLGGGTAVTAGLYIRSGDSAACNRWRKAHGEYARFADRRGVRPAGLRGGDLVGVGDGGRHAGYGPQQAEHRGRGHPQDAGNREAIRCRECGGRYPHARGNPQDDPDRRRQVGESRPGCGDAKALTRPVRVGVQSSLTPSFRPIVPHLSASALMAFANSSGVLAMTSLPWAISVFRTSALFATAAISRASFSTMGRGVFAGATYPYQLLASNRHA
jgi:hypothetical protein